MMAPRLRPSSTIEWFEELTTLLLLDFLMKVSDSSEPQIRKEPIRDL
jgi:hypothetical protein